jgi:hypothetical protein
VKEVLHAGLALVLQLEWTEQPLSDPNAAFVHPMAGRGSSEMSDSARRSSMGAPSGNRLPDEERNVSREWTTTALAVQNVQELRGLQHQLGPAIGQRALELVVSRQSGRVQRSSSAIGPRAP